MTLSPDLRWETRDDGTIRVWRADPPGAYPARMVDRLVHWATFESVHALVALAAQYVGVPSAAISPAYSLASSDHAKLRDIAAQITPGRVFADDGAPFPPAIAATGPFAMNCMAEQDVPGDVGIPAQGCEPKLVPLDDKLKARVRGPHITPGQWRNPELTVEAFDEEGFHLRGDALRCAVPGDPSQGLYSDGRIAETFKLRTGTRVAVGPLQAKPIDRLGGLAARVGLDGRRPDDLPPVARRGVDMLRGNAPGRTGVACKGGICPDPRRKVADTRKRAFAGHAPQVYLSCEPRARVGQTELHEKCRK